MTAVDVVPLDALADRVREAHAEVEEHGRATVAAAIRAGEALTEAKAAVVHGEWLPWLAENFPAHRDTASNYMRLAANAERVPHLTDAGSMREALALVAGPSREPGHEPDDATIVLPGQTDLSDVLPGHDRPAPAIDSFTPPDLPDPVEEQRPEEPEVVDAHPVPDWAIRDAEAVAAETTRLPAQPDAVQEMWDERRRTGQKLDTRFGAIVSAVDTLKAVPAPEHLVLPPDRENVEALGLDLNWLNDWIARMNTRWSSYLTERSAA